MHMIDLTRTLISNDTIREQVGSIFPDALILTTHFTIVSVSQNIIDTLGYSRAELTHQPLDFLSRTWRLKKEIEQKLRAGYFDEENFEISTKEGNSVLFSVSGFYLGLVADINGLIVLRMRNLEEINLMYDRLEAKTVELDRFIYHAAHSLRGPLATLRGLVNVSKLSEDVEEQKFLINKIDQFAGHLDDKLYRLIYFAESDKGNECPDQKFSFRDMTTELQRKITQEHFEGQVDFQCGFDQAEPLKNGALIFSLMQNLFSFLFQQQREENASLWIDALPGTTHLEIIVRSEGFVMTPSVKAKLQQINFGYAEILNSPELINCYAAKKITFKLHGSISFTMVEPTQLIVHIILPTDFHQ